MAARDTRGASLKRILWISLYLFCGFFCRGTAKAADIRRALSTPVGSGSQLAIADVDGKLCPVSVSVQVGSGGFSTTTTYRIQVQFGELERQSIQVDAPAGGLWIVPRDINNGNHFIDLVVVTAWFRNPVAILINDGRGRFSKVEPTTFPEVFTDFSTNWGCASGQIAEAVCVAPQSRSCMCLEASGLPNVRQHANSLSSPRPGFLFRSFLISLGGRAPPFEAPRF
jgi:hypothetical protein